jgi:hypothetical protein
MDPSTLAGFEQMAQMDPQVMEMMRGMMGNLGVMGQPLDVGEFYDPYQQEVIGSMQSDFDRMRASSLNAVGGQAGAQRAFGGSRHALAEGAAIGEIGRAEGSTIAGLRSSGYQQAVANALANRGQMAGMGMGAANFLNMMNQQSGQAQIGLGDYRRGVEQQGRDAEFQEFMRRIGHGERQVGLLNQTMSASPYGQTQTTEKSGSLLSGLTGLAGFAGSFLLPGASAGLGIAKNLFSGGGGENTSGYGPSNSPFFNQWGS